MRLSEFGDAGVLIIDDEKETLRSFSLLLKSAGLKNIITLEDPRETIPTIMKNRIATVLLDLRMPYLPGTELLRMIKGEAPQIPLIVVTASSELETAVECMKEGAFDYIVKPVEKERLLTSVKKALELSSLRDEIFSLKESLLSQQLRDEEAFKDIYTLSPRMHALFRYAEAIAKTNQPILITGETGVGKELFARAIHKLSRRAGKLVSVNIAGLDDHVFSDTLFGHKKGAFTGADQPREGLVAQAKSGTLFLDEIGDLDEPSQVKLLRLLQEREYFPLGSDLPRHTDARIIVSTNRNLQGLINEGRFRRDLYYRLRAHQIEIPPLRERKEDIPILLEHFLSEASEQMGKQKPSYPPELLTLLSTYHFPGNVRELRSMVFDAVAIHQKGVLSMERFRSAISRDNMQPIHKGADLSPTDDCLITVFGRFPRLKEMETFLISESLRLAKGNQGIAAGLLGISRQALNKRLTRTKEET